MADQKISELTNITGANLADADEFVVVDVSADQTKAVTRAEFFKDTPSIGIGTTSPSNTLHVSSSSNDGIFLEDSSNSGGSPFIKARGKRSDSNNSQSFSGKLLLDGHRTDAAVATGKKLGMVAFGGNHTNGSDTNILYSASISGVSEGTFNNSTTMPTGLAFFTGSTGRSDTTANVTYGDEAMRIDASGSVGIGTASPTEKLSVQAANLGTNAGNSVDIFSLRSDTSNTDKMLYTAKRISAGTDWTTAAHRMQRKVDATLMGYMQFGSVSSDLITFGEYNTEYMRIDGSGNVGIGTTTPTEKLMLQGDAPNILISNTTETKAGVMFGDAQALAIQNASIKFDSSTEHLRFSVNNVERMNIDGNGNTSFKATKTLYNDNTDEEGFIIGNTGTLQVSRVSQTPILMNRQNTLGGMISFYADGVYKGGISVSTSATAYNTTSDYRLKENITPVQGAADIVKAMRPVTYTFKSDGSWHDGFLAHELQELHPRAVVGEKDAMQDEEYEVTPAVYEDISIPAVEAVAEVPAVYDDEGVLVSEMVPAVEAEAERTEQQLVSEAVMGTRSVPDYQGVDYSKLTPILTAALQEALNKIDALETRLTALEG